MSTGTRSAPLWPRMASWISTYHHHLRSLRVTSLRACARPQESYRNSFPQTGTCQVDLTNSLGIFLVYRIYMRIAAIGIPVFDRGVLWPDMSMIANGLVALSRTYPSSKHDASTPAVQVGFGGARYARTLSPQQLACAFLAISRATHIIIWVLRKTTTTNLVIRGDICNFSPINLMPSVNVTPVRMCLAF